MPKYSFSAREVQSLLNGFVCLFKPRDMSVSALEHLFLNSLCEQANVLANPDRPLPVIEMPIVKEHASGALVVVGHRKQVNYSLHPLVVGKMFRPQEFQMEALNYLEPSSSGVCLFGLNQGCDQLEQIREQAWLSEYRIDAELGRETHEHTIRGKVTHRLEYDHVNKHRMNTLLSVMRMQFKSASFQFANVDLQSQEAFELARRGMPKPKVLGSPLIYNLDLTSFKAPLFSLQVQTVGENDKFLRELISTLGYRLDTTACPRRLRRVRQGCFGLEHALLEKHLHLESVVKNVLMCTKMVKSELNNNNADVIEVKATTAQEDKRALAMVEKHGDDDGDSLLRKYRLTNKHLEAEELPELEDCLRLPFGRDYSTC